MGSRFYTAPEQWRDAKNVTQAADIYSAGKILQAMLVAGLPGDAQVPPGRRLGPVAQLAFSQEPQHRHQSAVELLAAIEATAAPAPAGRWETPAERSLRLRRRLAVLFDPDAATEIIRWADQVSPDETADFALALSALPANALEVWWLHYDSAGFTRAFKLYADALQDTGFDFKDCDPLADLARRAADPGLRDKVLRPAPHRPPPRRRRDPGPGNTPRGCPRARRTRLQPQPVACPRRRRGNPAVNQGRRRRRQRPRRPQDGRTTGHRMDSRPRRRRHPAPDPAGRDSTDPRQAGLKRVHQSWTTPTASGIRGP